MMSECCELIDWQTLFIIILIFIIVDKVSTSIIITCLFLVYQYISLPEYNMQQYNPNRARMRVEQTREGFGNTHEYETQPQIRSVNNATSKDAWQNFQEIQRRVATERPFILTAHDSSGINPNSKNGSIESMVDNILYPRNATIDDKMALFTSHNERKSKKSLEYRSGATRDKFERFFNNELDMHEHREWWYDPRDEYGDKHVVF